MKCLLYISLILSLTETSLAGLIAKNNCAPIDIRTANPKIKKSPALKVLFSTPRDQDSMGWCYAFAAADMMSAHLGFPVSALHTSIIYNNYIHTNPISRAEMELGHDKKKYQEIYEGGNVSGALDMASKNKWICTEKGLPFDAERSLQVYQMLKDLEDIKLKSRESNKNLNNLCEDISKTIAPFKVMNSNLMDIAAGITNENMNITLKKFADSACTERINNVPEMKLVTESKESLLGLPNLGYMSILNKKISRGEMVQFNYQVKGIAPFKGAHSSVILGRRWKNGKCEYNVRNSWGQSCAHYEKNIECNKQEGTYWITDEKLYSASYSYRYFK